MRGDAGACAIAAVESDSRRVVPGALFVALRGEHFDGHAYVAQAIAAGAAAVVVDSPVRLSSQTVLVDRARYAARASSLAAAFYGDPSHALDVVGVTGTNGKTTTVHMLRGILEQAGVPTERSARRGLVRDERSNARAHDAVASRTARTARGDARRRRARGRDGGQRTRSRSAASTTSAFAPACSPT